MANYSNLKAAIAAAIKTNGNQEITGQVLQDVLTSVVSVIGANYTFAGVAAPATNPGTPDQNVVYIALDGGTYTNFNGTVLPAGISLLMWNGTWTSETVMYGDGGVFDISVYKSTGGTLATFADLADALDGGNNIPASARKGGMSVKFVQSSDNKYMQYRLTSNSFSITITDWQKIDRDDYAPKMYLDKYDGNSIIRRLFVDTSGYTGSVNLDIIHIDTLQAGLPIGGGKYYWGFALFAGIPDNRTYITDQFSFITDNNTPPTEILSKTVYGIYVYAEFDWSKATIGTIYGPYIIQPYARQKTQDPRGSIHQENLDATLKTKLAQIQTNTEEISEVSDDVDEINGAIEYNSKNLFDATKVENGYVADDGNFFIDPAAPAGKYLTSNAIEVKPNTIYYLQGRAAQSVQPVPTIACYDENGTPLRVLQPIGVPFIGQYYYMYGDTTSVKNPNGGFMTPPNAKTLRFTLVWDYTPNPIGDVMLEEVGKAGTWDLLFQPSPYQPYEIIPEIKTESLPESVSILKGKKILYNGDSICNPRLLFSAAYNNGGAYQTLISEATGSINVNYAVDGASISNNGSGHKIVLDVVNMDSDADLVCFEGGINDWAENRPLGTYTQGDYSSTFDDTTILGAMESIFQQSLAKWPGIPIVFVIVHKVHNSFVPHGPSGDQHTFAEVKDKMIEVCNKWGIPYYNAFDNAALNGGIASQVGQGKFLYDEWHPARKGYVHYYVPQLIKIFEAQMQVNRDY